MHRLDVAIGPNKQEITGYVEAPLAYDAVWALALALNRTINRYALFLSSITNVASPALWLVKRCQMPLL